MGRAVASLTTLAVLCLLSASALAQRSGNRGPNPENRNRYGLASPRPRTPGAIRIATYNVLNLFDHEDDPALSGEWDDAALGVSDDRCRGIAAAILAVDADIIALEEMESLAALTWFRDTYLSDAGYDHLASLDAGYYRGVECSVMSRFPITDAEVWPGASLDDARREGPGWSAVPPDEAGRMKFQRSPLRVTIQVNDDYELTIFALHHKAGRDYRYKREAEALKILELIDAVRRKDPRRNIVVMGDFNAAPWDKSYRAYLYAGLIDAHAHRVIAPRNMAQEESNLHKTHESGRVLDYILLNSAAHRELVIGSPHVYGTLYDPSYDYRKDPYPAGYAADHYPVVIDLVPRDVP